MLKKRSHALGKVAIALSGGVDSAAAALLLRESGYDVFAITMLLKEGDRQGDAVQIAQALGLEHHSVDLTELFASQILKPFAQSYARGETPSPCVRCNQFIKFGALAKAARAHGAVAMATGHYARRLSFDDTDEVQLHTALEASRDQSYFLSALTQEQVLFLRLPLGGVDKATARSLVARAGLARVAAKPDSQDVCFAQGPKAYLDVVHRFCGQEGFEEGAIVDEQGRVLGRHKGLAHFTVGQRKGLGLGARRGETNAPLFVAALDAAAHRVCVAPRESLARRAVSVRSLHWIAGHPPLQEDDRGQKTWAVMAKLRSAQAAAPAVLRVDGEDGGGVLTFEAPVYGVAKGQRAAFYDGSRLLGGGWIDKAIVP